MANLEFEKQNTSDFEFFSFKNEGDSFIGTFVKEHDGENTEPKGIEGFMFKDVNGELFMLPNYYKIGEFVKEKQAEGIDVTKRVVKIEFVKTVDLKGGQTMKKFNFYLAKESTPAVSAPEVTGTEKEEEEEEEEGETFSARRKKSTK